MVSEVPFGSDGDFSHEKMQDIINAKLSNDLGNLAYRTLSFAYKHCAATVPTPGPLNADDEAMLEAARALLPALRELADEMQLHRITQQTNALVQQANRYIDTQAPWSLRKTDPARMQTVLWVLMETMRYVGIVSQPVTPTIASALLDQLAVPKTARAFSALVEPACVLAGGGPLPMPQIIVPRYEATEEEAAADAADAMAKAAKAEAASAASAAAAKAGTAAAKAAATAPHLLTGAALAALEAQVRAQGDKVRTVKAAIKAGEVEEGALQPELAELIALKSQLPPDMFGKFRDQQENLSDTARPALPTKRGNPIGSPMRRAQDAVRQGNVSYALSTAMAAIALAGPACSVFECNQLLRVLGDSGHVDAMMAIFDAMVAAGAMPTQVTYGTLISRAGACRQPQLASRFYRDMLRRGLEPDAQTLNSLINAYAKAGHVSKAYAAADVMRKRGVSPTLITYNTLLDACARGGNVSLSLAYQTLQQVLAAKLQPNARTFSILIHLCARVGRVDDAFGWFRRMVAAGETPTAVTYSTLVNACGRAGQLERAFAVLDQMSLVGLQPNVVTYTSLLDACAKARQLPRALGVFRAMIAAGVQPNRITCTALFHGCLTAGEVLLAREVIKHMSKLGLTPSAHSFTALLTATTNLDSSEQNSAAVACLLRQMAAAGVASGGAASAGTSSLASAAAPKDAADAADAALQSVVTGGDQKDGGKTSLEDSILGILEQLTKRPRASRIQQSLALLDTVLSARLRPPTALWLTLFAAADTSIELQAAVKRFHRARDAGLASRDSPESAALVAATARIASSPGGGGGSEGSESLQAEGGAEKVRPQRVQPFLSSEAAASSKPVAAASDTLQAVFTVFTEMRAAGVAPDLAAFNALINACASVGDVSRAEGAFGELCAAGLSPDTISYTSLIKACAVAGDAARADRVYHEMQQRTNHFSTFTPPSAHTYRHLMAVHLEAAHAHTVLDLFDEMKARGIAPGHAHYAAVLGAITLHSELPSSVRRAEEVYEAMRHDGFRLDTRTLLQLDSLCRRHDRVDLASRLRRERSIPPRLDTAAEAVVARRSAEMARQADEAARAEAEAVRLQEAEKLAEERRRAVLSRLRSGGTSVKWGEIS